MTSFLIFCLAVSVVFSVLAVLSFSYVVIVRTIRAEAKKDGDCKKLPSFRFALVAFLIALFCSGGCFSVLWLSK
ncbi:MAG: hypothetical protein AB7U85_09030 [Alphaproteobacteria bacterium]